MGFWGAFSGSVVGGAKGSIIGALVGAVAGSWIEEKFVRPLFPRLRREPRESPSHHEVPCVHPLVREYAILGVDVEASDEEVKSAYYSLALHRGVSRQWPAAELGALNATLCPQILLKEVSIIFITPTIVWH